MIRFDFNADVERLKKDARAYYDKYQPPHHQVCVTGTDPAQSPLQGTGSLYYDWKDSNTKVRYDKPKQETEFTYFLEEFKGQYVEEIYNQLTATWKIGRLRFMFLRPKTCLSWHLDDTPRIHIPIHTDIKKTAMVLNDEVLRMPADGSAYLVDTTKYHTVFNGWDEVRIHLVGVVLG